MKIFVIGFNKTGSTSLFNLFENLKIKSVHTYLPVISIIDDYDAFTDGYHINFEEYYYKCPDSLFILNTRPMSKWLISRYKHAINHNFEKCWCWPVSEEKTNDWITNREDYYQKILDFFVDKPKQLLIVNIEKENWETAVSTFIQKPYLDKKIHENKIEQEKIDINKINLIIENVSNCLKKRGYNGNELLFKDTDLTPFEYTTFL
jgi:hypothetical protein